MDFVPAFVTECVIPKIELLPGKDGWGKGEKHNEMCIRDRNNLPELAWQTALNALEEAGLRRGEDFLLTVAPRKSEEKVMVF